jgi:uncharacterized membrane protein YkoI
MPLRRSLLLTLPAAFLAFATAASHARADDDAARARAALQAGQIEPLASILATVAARYQGDVIDTELEHEQGLWLYELVLLPPSGRIFKLRIDAASGKLLGSEGPLQER